MIIMKTNTTILILAFLIVTLPTKAQWSNSGNNYTTGKLALGTGSNFNTLYVYGSNSQNLLKVENSRDSDAGIEFESNLANFKLGAGIGIGSNSFTIYDINALAIRMLINSTGQVGINTTSPTSGYKLDVNGSLRVANDIYSGGNLTSFDVDATYIDGFEGDFYNLYYNNIYSSSDKRLKNNIEEDGISHESIYKIKTYNYQFKDDNEHRTRYGVIAQDFKEIFPDLVSEDNEGYLAVNYIDMIPLMLRALQDQKQMIDALNSELNSLKENINESHELSDLEIEKDYIKIYPNPSNEKAKIELFGEINDSKIELVNLNGEIIKSINTNGNRILDLNNSNLIDGIYFVRYIMNGKLKQTKRILIQK